MHRNFKISACLILILCFCLSISAMAVTPQEYNKAFPEKLDPGHLYGRSCILINADTGDILFEKDADTRRYPASTTKIMTCILALEYGPMGQQVTLPAGITVDSSSSRMNLNIGDTMLFDDLVYGMMLASGNDAAKAIAVIISGSEARFVQLMNQKAAELGMTVNTTHFDNVHGLHSSNHYTTARDLAAIMAYALKNPTFRDIIACQERTIYSVYWPDGKKFTTKYDLIVPGTDVYYEYCIGGKTGYTSQAGRSFVGAAEKDGTTLVAVSLLPTKIDSTDKSYVEAFTDNVRLFKYGFLQYTSLSFRDLMGLCAGELTYPVANEEEGEFSGWVEIKLSDGSGSSYYESYLSRELNDSARLSEITADFKSRLEIRFMDGITDENGSLLAPLNENVKIGEAIFRGQDGILYSCDVVPSRDVKERKMTTEEIVRNRLNENALLRFLAPATNPPILILYVAVPIILLVVISSARSKRRRRNRSRKAQFEKRKREYLRRMKEEEHMRKRPPQKRPVNGMRPVPRKRPR